MVTEEHHTDQNHSPEHPLESNGLYPDPGKLLDQDSIDLNILKKLIGRSILSVDQFDKELVLEICKFAALLEATEIDRSHPLDGKIVITAFFEASTRTRLSFESAVLRLDGKILSIPSGMVTGVAKGESLSDIGEMFNAYGDLVVLRHTETDAVEEVSRNLRLPLINAGNGSGEHPTQALADWFAILKWKPRLKAAVVPPPFQIHLGILGTPGSMRAVNSFLRMSLLFKAGIRKISIVSEMADPLGPELESLLEDSEIEFQLANESSVYSETNRAYTLIYSSNGQGGTPVPAQRLTGTLRLDGLSGRQLQDPGFALQARRRQQSEKRRRRASPAGASRRARPYARRHPS